MIPLHSLWRRRGVRVLLAALVLLYSLYVALAYLYLPGKLRQTLETEVAHRIGRVIRVEQIDFNPFALSLAVTRLRVSETSGVPMLEWQRFFTDFELWQSLFGWQVALGELHLDAPQFTVELRKDGLSFTDIVRRLDSGAAPRDTSPSRLAFRIQDIRLRDGVFRFNDLSGRKQARSEIANIDIGVQSLYLATGDDQLNPFHLKARLPAGGNLDLSGQYRLDPLRVQGSVKAAGIQVRHFGDFVENYLPLTLAGGQLDLGLNLLVEQQAQDVQVSVQQGELRLSDLALDDAVADPPLLRMQALQVSGVELDLLQRRVRVAQVATDGVVTHLWRDENGVLRTAALQAPAPAASTTASPASVPETGATAAPPVAPVAPKKAPPSPWQIQVAGYHLGNGRVQFQDRADGLDATQTLDQIDLQLSDIRLDDGAGIPLRLQARLNDTGTLDLNGTLSPAPFALHAQYQARSLPLLPFDPYVQASTHVQLQQGTLDSSGELHLTDTAPLTLRLKAVLRDLQGRDRRNQQPLFQWQTLSLDPLQLDLAQKTIRIDDVQLVQPELHLAIAANKQVNLASLLKTGPQTTPAPAEGSPWQFRIGQFQIHQGRTRFHDDSIQPAFAARLDALEFQVRDLASDGRTPSPFSLQAKVDRFAPLSVKGTLAPLPRQPGFAFTSSLKGLDLPALSSYSGTYVGYELKSGKLALDLQYELRQRKLSGNNRIVAKDLYLGDAVASAQAVDAPVALGLALLRDNRGVIDLDVGVSGDLDAPGFSVSGVILKALLNVFVKAAASPFALLGSLVGGREDLGDIEFAPGSAELDGAAQDKLRQLAQALNQRTTLNVTLRGNALAADDLPGLQWQRLMQQVAQARKVPLAPLTPAVWLEDEDNREALEDLADALDLPDQDDREAALRRARPELDAAARTGEAFRQMLAEVAGRQGVSEADLKRLARERAEALRTFLVEGAGFDHERIDMAKATLDARICKLVLEPR